MLLLLFGAGFVTETQATHTKGGNFWVEQLTSCTYRVYFRDYTSCDAANFTNLTTTYTGPFNNPGGLAFGGTGCGTPVALGGWTLASQQEVTPLCPVSTAVLNYTNCDVSNPNPSPIVPGHWERIGYRDYDLCGITCTNLRISYTACCWENTVLNIVGPPDEYEYIDLNLAPVGAGSPVPHSSIPHYIDAGEKSKISLGHSDPDGDSLAYSLVPVLNNMGVAHPYQPGYSPSQPMGPFWSVFLNPQSGVLTVDDIGGGVLGTYLIAYEVREYKAGVLMSTTHVPFEVTTVDNSVTPISTRATIDTAGISAGLVGGLWLGGKTFQGTVGTPMQIPVSASDPNPGDLTLMILHSVMPGGAVLTDVSTGLVVDTLSGLAPNGMVEWTPPASGQYSFEIQLDDPSECGVYLKEQNSYVYTIMVDSCSLAVDISPDSLTICSGDVGMATAVPSGGTPISYLWSDGSTLPTVSVTTGGTYVVWVVDAIGCVATDTLIVTEEFVPAGLAGPDTLLCPWLPTYTTGAAAIPGFTYNWYETSNPGTTLATTSQFTLPLVSGDSTSLTLEVTSPNGCMATDVVEILVEEIDTVVINFIPDTVCVGDTVMLDIGVPMLPGSFQTITFDGNATVIQGTAPFVEVVWTQAGAGFVHVMIDNACGAIDTLQIPVFVSGDCIWPGDTDTDGVANNADLLNIGLGFGTTGPARTGASISWTAQPFSPWAASAPTGENYAHADTDGNGTINDDDTLAVVQNYGLTHLKNEGSEGGPGDPSLLVLPMIDSAYIGDTVMLPVILGTNALPADSVYGLSFTIQYDQTLVDSATAEIGYTGSWLGTKGVDMLGIQHDKYSDGEIDVALTRTDQMDRNGSGTIATFSIVMIDDLAGKNGLKEVLKFDIINVKVINAQGELIEVYNQPSELLVTDNTTSLDQAEFRSLMLAPNPSAGQVALTMPVSGVYEAEVTDLTGRVILRKEIRENATISLEDQPNGVYLVKVNQGNTYWVGKVLIQH